MNSALKQFSMHVVFAKVIIRPASFIKACTSTSTNQMVRAAAVASLSLGERGRVGGGGTPSAAKQVRVMLHMVEPFIGSPDTQKMMAFDTTVREDRFICFFFSVKSFIIMYISDGVEQIAFYFSVSIC